MFYTDLFAERPARGRVLLEELEAQGNLSRLNYLLFGMMFVTLGTGDLEETVELCDRGIAVAARIGVPPVQYATIKAIALGRLGRIDESFASLGEEIADEAHRLGRAFRELGRAIVHHELQDFGGAVRILEEAPPLIEELARAWMQDSMHMLLARAVHEGDLQDQVDLGPTLEYLQGLESATAGVALGEHALASGDLETALEQAERAEVIAERRGRRPEVAMALELQARIRITEGDYEAALLAARRGDKLAEATKYRPLLWQLHAQETAVLEGLGRADEADHARSRAAETIQAIASNVSDEVLREIFLTSPAVSAVLEQAES